MNRPRKTGVKGYGDQKDETLNKRRLDRIERRRIGGFNTNDGRPAAGIGQGARRILPVRHN